MIGILLCLSCLSLYSSGSPTPTGDIQCPALPCPLPPCDNPHPTFYMYHGKLCQGCSQCNVSHVQCPYLPCPYLPCSDNDTYTVFYAYQGVLCEGCKQCRTYGTHEEAHFKRQLTHLLGCPIVDCAYPGPCLDGTLTHTTFYFHGHQCPGCPVCAVTTTTPQA